MKQLLLSIFLITLFVACDKKPQEDGQSTYSGKITYIPNPCLTKPCLPGVVFGLKTTLNNHVLSINAKWFNNRLIIDNIEYFVDDEVEITGIMTTKQDVNSNGYTELEIHAIKKLTSNIEK